MMYTIFICIGGIGKRKMIDFDLSISICRERQVA